MIMKVGQTLANYPNVLPQDFAETLDKLNFEAPPMHYALLREQVCGELGADPEDLFAEFETRAFAAASLGQVHRARLKTGERVAVKIQYPGIARTIDSDVTSVLTLLAPMRLTAVWDSIRRQWEDVREMLKQEADYTQEAEFLRRARSVFDDHEGIVIPRVHDRYSTQRVLTMDFLDGVHIGDYLKTYRSQEERDRYGELIMRASFRIAHAARLWYADSNPGNYLFLRDGRLGVIDFGCCRDFTPEEWDYYCDMGKAHRAGGQRLREAMIRATASTLTEDDLRLVEDMAHWYSDYLLHEGPFDFSSEQFIQRGIDMIGEACRRRLFFSQPINNWICRQLLGLRALAFRLKARINMKRLNEEESRGVFV
jgi:predicted unusual protein kinase regulating ubiquinone biosynthesis (AarF/ABC1/UbiB family)